MLITEGALTTFTLNEESPPMRHLLIAVAFLAMLLVPTFFAASYGFRDTPDNALPPE
jgi:hypothetical protein